ncbi:hypothetical protein [Entomospira culicis]|uniref:DUF4340 domain-containing protein n=1 Tax=Entomospira culicis TaxID=2719989 RepID=A0A968GGQ6_9SPIO|nr:hypothetical protein [Entomospira culicis]NIZ19788.1 hypothetical protein [Entomospira culicis]NIZ70002.1 hypothetical protein [Entomospira culicis]WDI37107.1 hypothetical protein PVA46_07240 [Entomospira culicis]WDI38736.1 hypothetical protein PVA47_07250 [Entomospira culicis]
MRQLAVIFYLVVVGVGVYIAYQWNSSRLPERVRLQGFQVVDVEKLVIERGQIVLTLVPDLDDPQRWIFSSNLDAVRAYGVDSPLVMSLISSLQSAKYAYLVENSSNQSLQRYGLGVQERYSVELWLKEHPEPYRFTLGALAVNGYDVYLLHNEHVYRASFLGLYERMGALGQVIDATLGANERLFG